MAIQQINIGAAPNDKTGDKARDWAQKTNANFTNPDHAASKIMATPSQALAGTAGVIPDAAGVHAAFKQFGLGGNLVYTNSTSSFSEKIYEVTIPSLGEVAVPLPTNASEVLVTGYTLATGNFTGFKGRFYKTGGTTWIFQNLHGITGSSNYPSIGVTGNVPVFKNPHPSTSYSFVWKVEAVSQSSGTAVNVFGSNQIVGTVAQSGGVPTGAIIESGSNANGTYTKYADGTMVCSHIISVASIACTTADTIFGFKSPNQTWTYPATFTTVNSYQISGLSTPATFVAGVGTSSAQYVWHSVNSSAAATRLAGFLAIGRWY